MSLNQTRAQKIRGALLSIAQNESVFLFVAFVSYSFLSTDVLAWYADSIAAFNRFVVLPWGGALCLLRLCRAQERKLEPHADIRFLVLLYAWIVVPFGIRFGLTAINANDWFHCMVAFFGVYALITEETVQRREMLLDVAGALFAALSFVMGALLLYCAFTVQTFGTELSETPFGIYENMYFLSAGFHYNTTGMFAVCCTLMSLLGVVRRRHPLAKLAHLIPSLMMAAVVVLSQSRTARYSMLGAWAVGCYGVVAGSTAIPKKSLRQLAAVAAGVAVLVGGYMGAAVMTDSAIRHYESVLSGKKEASVFASAVAEEAQQPDEPQAADKQELLGRGFGDMSVYRPHDDLGQGDRRVAGRAEEHGDRFRPGQDQRDYGRHDDAQRISGLHHQLRPDRFCAALLFLRLDGGADVPRFLRAKGARACRRPRAGDDRRGGAADLPDGERTAGGDVADERRDDVFHGDAHGPRQGFEDRIKEVFS